MASLAQLAARLEPDLVRQVFTHSSWARDRTLSYERLEFLGDSVLGICISTDIYNRFPDYNEGELAKIRAYVVSRHTCAKVAAALGLAARLEEAAKEAEALNVDALVENENVMAAVLEAVIGGIYMQFGLETVMDAVITAFEDHISYAANEHVDYKTVLQEEAARHGREVVYTVVGVEGPPHARQFASEVALEGKVLGHGQGRTKKVSQQEAAKEALEALRALNGGFR